MSYAVGPFNSQDVPVYMPHISLEINCKNLLDQGNISPAAIGYHCIWIMLVR